MITARFGCYEHAASGAAEQEPIRPITVTVGSQLGPQALLALLTFEQPKTDVGRQAHTATGP